MGASEGADEVTFKRLNGAFGFVRALILGCNELPSDVLGVEVGLELLGAFVVQGRFVRGFGGRECGTIGE
jgi:hypothetical protein